MTTGLKKVSYKSQINTRRNSKRSQTHQRKRTWIQRSIHFELLHSTALLEEETEDQQQKAGLENMPKHHSIFINYVTIISPLIQLLEQITKQQYQIKALAKKKNQVKVQPKHLNPTEQL
jgi:hypothetical protein